MLNQNDQIKLDKFLKRISSYFKHVPYTERLVLIRDLKDFLGKDIEDSRVFGKSVSETLGKYRNRKALANNILQKHGFSKSEKSFDGFNLFLIVLFTGTLAVLIALTFFMKSLFPLFEVDDINGKLKLFGGKITLDEDDFEAHGNFTTKIIINGEEVDFQTLKAKQKRLGEMELKGDFPVDQIDELNILAETGSFEIVEGGKNISYKCNTDEVLEDYIKMKDRILKINLVKKVDCFIKVPNQISFKLRLNKGRVKLKDLKQDFSVILKKGDILWEQKEKLNYGMSQDQLDNLDLSWENGTLSPFKGKIEIEQGELSIK